MRASQKHGKAVAFFAVGMVVLPSVAGWTQSAGAGRSATIGNFSIANYDQYQMRLNPAGTISGQMSGYTSGPQLRIKTALYEMTAPHITYNARKAGTPPAYKLTTVNAKGGVRLVVKNAEATQTTVATGDTADYKAVLNAPKSGEGETGRVHFQGHFHTVTTDPALASPLVQDSQAGTIVFLADGSLDILLEKGSITGTPKEPEPRKKPQ